MATPQSCQEYLRTAYETAKAGQPRLTIASYAQKLGLNGSTLKMVMSCQRKLTVRQALQTARALQLPEAEALRLETMALRDAAKDAWMRAHYTRRLQHQTQSGTLRTIQASDRELLTDPVTFPLLIYLVETQQRLEGLDTAKVSQIFKCSEQQIRRTVAHLQKQGWLENRPDGKFHILFDRLNHRLLQKRYMKNLLQEATRRVETEFENRSSAFVSYTLATDAQSLQALRQDLQSVLEKYLVTTPAPDADRQIAQACFQLFTVAKF